jgi:hypothetical protein
MENLLNRAFQLAYFIHRDRRVAIRIVKGAMNRLEVAATTQGKRLYYRPTGRSSMSYNQKGGFRNKVTFSEAHLLQRLVYIVSEPYEKETEQESPLVGLDEEDLVVRYVKHLVKSAIKRNSFYATLGVSRLLYNYSTTQTMEIFYAVVQDPERVKDDYYYRSRKGVLMQELKERFGSLVKICRGQHGEERFQAHERTGQFAELVKESLGFFTPWGTLCPVPAGIDPIIEGVPELSNKGFREQDKTEVNRIHAVLHPDCYRRLVEALRFETPDRRLEIPQFYLSTDMNNGDGWRGRRLPTPADLDEQELVSIKKELDMQAERRRNLLSDHPLRIIVDGVERARLNLGRSRSIRFEMEGEAELIEVRGQDKAGDELLLASHLTTYEEIEKGARPLDASIVLEGGQKLSIVVQPDRNGGSTIIGVTYRETNLFCHCLYSSILALQGKGKLWFLNARRRSPAPARSRAPPQPFRQAIRLWEALCFAGPAICCCPAGSPSPCGPSNDTELDAAAGAACSPAQRECSSSRRERGSADHPCGPADDAQATDAGPAYCRERIRLRRPDGHGRKRPDKPSEVHRGAQDHRTAAGLFEALLGVPLI